MRRVDMVAALVALLAIAACSDGGSPPRPPNVTVTTDLAQTFDCEARDCLAGYRNFPSAQAAYAHPRDEASVRAELADVDQRPLPGVLPLGERELRDAIVEGLNVEFMLEGLDERDLHVTVFDEEPGEGFTERRLIFSDPLVGEFEALELVPLGDERGPAIIGLHGHFDNPTVFAERFMGEELAAAGYVVLMPRLRAMDCFGPEAEISLSLLESGFTLMGMRVYETLLLDKYLRASSRVDAKRIGLLTHSGGSSTGDLVVHLTRGIAAQVTDYFVDWRDHCTEFEFASIHCESLPALFPYGTTLADDAFAPVPRLVVPYAFEDSATREQIRSLFAEHLGGSR